jgi:hypothetical protein
MHSGASCVLSSKMTVLHHAALARSQPRALSMRHAVQPAVHTTTSPRCIRRRCVVQPLAAVQPPPVGAANFSSTPPPRDLPLNSLTAVTPLDGCALLLAAKYVRPRLLTLSLGIVCTQSLCQNCGSVARRVQRVRPHQVPHSGGGPLAAGAHRLHAFLPLPASFDSRRCGVCCAQTLSGIQQVVEVPPLSAAAHKYLDDYVAGFGPTEAEQVKTFEATTNHDVKAVEYTLKKCVRVL